MASMTRPVHRHDEPADDLRVERVAPEHRKQVFAMLLTGRTGASQIVDQFQAFASEHELCLDELWAAYAGPKPIAATLIVPTAGRTAMAFLSPVVDRRQVKPCALLLSAASQAQDPAAAALIQALLEPSQRLESQALTEAGYTKLAHLIYMQRPTEPTVRPPTFDPQLRVLHWSDANRDAFATAIVASYEKTLDCRGLLGLRHIDDILAGHLATGAFKPELWLALYHRDEPVGVLLVNPLPPRRAAELVYLGLTPPWRGKGLARRLVIHGLNLAHQHHADSMILAVDQVNTPAVRLYQSMRFAPTARKLAMIFTLT